MHDLFGNAYIRKTEPLGIPYMGSKRKYADTLISRIMDLAPHAKYFYDICGGGAMTFAALQKGFIVHYNELQSDMCELMRYICNPTTSRYGIFPEHFYEFITRKKFIELRNQSGLYAQFARICYSFGNKQTSYAFGRDVEPLKQAAHNAVMYQCKQSMDKVSEILGVDLQVSDLPTWNERRLKFGQAIKSNKKRLDLQQLEQLQQLERLQQLPNITITNLSYNDVQITTPPHETIIYLDPPYRGTAKYIESLNYDELDAWFAGLPCIAFMSEYNAPFRCVHEIKTRSTLSPTNNNAVKIERLYINDPIPQDVTT